MSMQQKILFIDDSEAILKDVTKLLEEANYQVKTSNRALGVAKLIFEFEPDLILLDINIPILSGEDLLNVISENLDEVPSILLFSSQEENELKRIVAEKNLKGYIQKSDRNNLLSAIKQHI